MKKKPRDPHLQRALSKAYAARSALFHQGVSGARMRALFARVDARNLAIREWPIADLGISEAAFTKAKAQNIEPHKFFVHPTLLTAEPQLVAYYRNLAAVSQKGISQLGFPTRRFERDSPSAMNADFALGLAQTLNSIISKRIEEMAALDIADTRDVVFAELGTELQGTWVNLVGKGAAKAVEGIIANYVSDHGLGVQEGAGVFKLASGWRIVFASEPDIAFTDPQGVERIAVEIKGSLDKAGAQTRYGEAKKTFAKALSGNPRCHTVYLASCFTEAVVKQIQEDGQVREYFYLTSIISDARERESFLSKIFHVVNTPI
ncbi:MAG: XcyI family restriction endonuclease [Tepidisphaeraceae bacterium]|jgi:XcyI-like restriction endonuclease